jgi:hypothetical protein
MELIKDTIQSVIASLFKKKQAAPEGDFHLLLKKVLTKKELEHIRVNNFKNGVLWVKVDSSAQLYALNLRKEDFLQRLSKEKRDLKSIRFYLGEVK